MERVEVEKIWSSSIVIAWVLFAKMGKCHISIQSSIYGICATPILDQIRKGALRKCLLVLPPQVA